MESMVSRGDFELLIKMLRDKNFDWNKVTLSRFADIEQALQKVPISVNTVRHLSIFSVSMMFFFPFLGLGRD